MAKASITIELDDEDRKRIDTLIEWLKASQGLRPTFPAPMPQWPAPWQSPVYCGSGVYVSDSTGQTAYNGGF